jgi:hypothetical protein
VKDGEAEAQWTELIPCGHSPLVQAAAASGRPTGHPCTSPAPALTCARAHPARVNHLRKKPHEQNSPNELDQLLKYMSAISQSTSHTLLSPTFPSLSSFSLKPQPLSTTHRKRPHPAACPRWFRPLHSASTQTLIPFSAGLVSPLPGANSFISGQKPLLLAS